MSSCYDEIGAALGYRTVVTGETDDVPVVGAATVETGAVVVVELRGLNWIVD